MDNISLEKIYAVIGELYLNSRTKIVEIESSFNSTKMEMQKLVEQYNVVNEERNRLLAEISHLKLNDKLPK